MPAGKASASRCRVLLVNPRFLAPSFWDFREACPIMGAQYPTAPLALITVAAMLPASWQIRLVDRNVATLKPEHLDWADLVLTTAMFPQQLDALEVIRLAHAHGKPIGDRRARLTSSPHIYVDADFRVLGEAELVIDDFIAAWERGERSGLFEAEKFKADVTRTPAPRFDLLRFQQLSLRRRAVFPRLSVYLRILRHHRAVRPRAALQDQCRRCSPKSQALYDLGSSRPCRLRRRQFHRQQEGDQAVPARAGGLASRAQFSRSSSRPRRRSISPTILNFCS